MGKAVDIPEDVYVLLEEQGQQRGLTVSEMIAQLSKDAESARLSMAIERLLAQGVILPQQPALASRKFSPVRVSGKPLSESIIEERR